jgi:hypothetical protein
MEVNTSRNYHNINIVFIMLKYFCVRIKVGFMKNTIMRNSIMELCSILNSLGKCFETLYLMVVVIVETQFLWTKSMESNLWDDEKIYIITKTCNYVETQFLCG